MLHNCNDLFTYLCNNFLPGIFVKANYDAFLV